MLRHAMAHLCHCCKTRNMVSVKICGITTTDALDVAIKSGAEYVGFVAHPSSPRHLPPLSVAELSAKLPDGVSSVVVCVNPSDTFLDEISRYVSPHFMQLHGNESPQRVQEIKTRYDTPIIKALSIATALDLAPASRYAGCADMLLLDAKTDDVSMPGGAGKSFDWSLLQGFNSPLPWFLSGGLNAENLADAVRISGAALVDVSSGVESSRGVKDLHKIRAFLDTARSLR